MWTQAALLMAECQNMHTSTVVGVRYNHRNNGQLMYSDEFIQCDSLGPSESVRNMADSGEARCLSVSVPGEEDERVSSGAPARQRNAWRAS